MLFFSLVDNKKIFFFDIRSLFKLVSNCKSLKHNNPYTLQPISQYAIHMMNKRINYLKTIKYNMDFEHEQLTLEQEYNNYVFSIFQKMDMLELC
jgi:hypothetical protein